MATELLDDELTFLRSVEQDVRQIQVYVRMSPAYRDLVASLKRKLNNRIIELLEEKDANRQRDTERDTQH